MCHRREIPQIEWFNRNSFPTVPVVLESKTKTEAEQGSLGAGRGDSTQLPVNLCSHGHRDIRKKAPCHVTS